VRLTTRASTITERRCAHPVVYAALGPVEFRLPTHFPRICRRRIISESAYIHSSRLGLEPGVDRRILSVVGSMVVPR
jgi:hypothetical protein